MISCTKRLLIEAKRRGGGGGREKEKEREERDRERNQKSRKVKPLIPRMCGRGPLVAPRSLAAPEPMNIMFPDFVASCMINDF